MTLRDALTISVPIEVTVPTPRLWHVTLTLSGEAHAAEVVKDALSKLADQHGFLHSVRYSPDRGEIAYWEEAEEMLDVAAMALRVWNEHRKPAGLPAWEVVGLEVLDRDTFRKVKGDRGRIPLGVHRPRPVPF